MRKFTLLFAMVFAFMSCNCQKKAVEQTSLTSNESSSKQEKTMPKLVYEANTRGFYQKITIENQLAVISSDRNGSDKGKTVKISDADWAEISNNLQAIKLQDLATFKDPTQKRFYDGAAIANLTAIVGEKEYRTIDFDHGFPPVEIEKMVNKIVSLGKE